MSENAKNETVKKKSWFQGVKAEFKKVIWPAKEQIAQNTITVVIVSVVLGLIIAGLDTLVKFGLNFLT
ncbi:MAG: preprotein translocase subunit SecE [Lachnospiraceae bacterium]|nr:preprotein translocase subunit SecE [Lachnospiraceae bacterium]